MGRAATLWLCGGEGNTPRRRRGDRQHLVLLSIPLRLFAALRTKRDHALFLTAFRHGYLPVLSPVSRSNEETGSPS